MATKQQMPAADYSLRAIARKPANQADACAAKAAPGG